MKSAFFEERVGKRDKLNIIDNSAPGKEKTKKVIRASRWRKIA